MRGMRLKEGRKHYLSWISVRVVSMRVCDVIARMCRSYLSARLFFLIITSVARFDISLRATNT